jgi:hypothetical protein
VIRCSDGARLDIPSLWAPSERAVVVWARTFGCPFCWWVLRVEYWPVLNVCAQRHTSRIAFRCTCRQHLLSRCIYWSAVCPRAAATSALGALLLRCRELATQLRRDIKPVLDKQVGNQ